MGNPVESGRCIVPESASRRQGTEVNSGLVSLPELTLYLSGNPTREAGAATFGAAAELSHAVEITGALRLLLSLPSLTFP